MGTYHLLCTLGSWSPFCKTMLFGELVVSLLLFPHSACSLGRKWTVWGSFPILHAEWVDAVWGYLMVSTICFGRSLGKCNMGIYPHSVLLQFGVISPFCLHAVTCVPILWYAAKWGIPHFAVLQNGAFSILQYCRMGNAPYCSAVCWRSRFQLFLVQFIYSINPIFVIVYHQCTKKIHWIRKVLTMVN